MKITLRAARVNAGFTLREASERLGISMYMIQKWERKPNMIAPAHYGLIEEVYGVSRENVEGFG